MTAQMRILTPIANAVSVYRKRLLRDRNANYEHLWRLIHLQEALIVSLGVITVTRLLHFLTSENNAKQLVLRNKLRSFVTGFSDDAEEFNQRKPLSESCLSGSLGAWVSVLNWFSSGTVGQGDATLDKLRNYLNLQSEPQNQFIYAFRAISPAADNYTVSLSRIKRFEAVNVLRNKLAHVPLPFDLIEPLHVGLRKELFSSIINNYDQKKDNIDSTNFFDILCGRFVSHSFIIAGANEFKENTSPDGIKEGQLFFETKADTNVRWCVSPFFHVDDVLNVSLLFRAPDFEPGEEVFKAEYHRFAAEARAVREERLNSTQFSEWFLESPEKEEPEPQQPSIEPSAVKDSGMEDISSDRRADEMLSETPYFEVATSDFPQGLDKNSNPTLLKHEAIIEFSRGDFKKADEYFGYLEAHPHFYNDVVALKHGQSLLRFAVGNELSADTRRRMLHKAQTLIRHSLHHRDERYRAKGHYELSKSYYRLFILDQSKEDLKSAISEANKAIEIEVEQKYSTWLEFLLDIQSKE